MKTSFTKIRRIVAASTIAAFATVAAASAQTQQNNQLALQLGAIQLGYTNNPTWYTNAQLLGNALVQGQQALLAKTTNLYTKYVGTNSASTNQPVAQSSDFRAELYQATLNALTSPVTNTNKYTTTNTINVVTYNPKTPTKLTTNKITSFGLNPALTTPTAVMAITTARVPDFGPGLISNAIAVTLAFTTNSNGVVFPVWGPQPSAASVKTATNSAQNLLNLNTKTATTQMNNASAVAKATLTAAVKAYANGTTQWAGVPKAGGPSNNVAYLPNFGTKVLGPTSNPQNPDLKGLSDAVAAIAANAINALGAPNTNSTSTTAGLYGQTAANVTKLTTTLTQVAASYQKISATSLPTSVAYPSGALGAESLGLVTQVAGADNKNWVGSDAAFLLQSIVNGAVKAVGVKSSNLVPIATGIAQGFYADYLMTTTDNPPLTASQFATTNNNASMIVSSFKIAMGGSAAAASTLTTLGITTANITTYFGNITTAINNGTNGVWQNTISGARGINLGVGTNTTAYLNGVGTPVTDTVGLQ